jgi:hypothetical protein
MKRSLPGLATILAAGWMIGLPAAHADSADCRIRSIAPGGGDASSTDDDDSSASQPANPDDAGALDPQLDDLSGILDHLPFKSFALEDDQTLHLDYDIQSAPLALPNGRLLKLRYLEHIDPNPPTEPTPKIRLKLTIRPPDPSAPDDVSMTFELDDGGTFLQLIDTGDEKLLVAQTCKSTP